MFRWVEENPQLGQVDVCVPNAGFSSGSSLLEGRNENNIDEIDGIDESAIVGAVLF